MKQRITLATWLVGWLTFLLSAAYLIEGIGQVKGFKYAPPERLIDICQSAITAGLFCLGASAVAIAIKKKDPE